MFRDYRIRDHRTCVSRIRKQREGLRWLASRSRGPVTDDTDPAQNNPEASLFVGSLRYHAHASSSLH